jgi:oligoendopeptidase F
LNDYYGDALDVDPLAAVTWARIPHFYNTPYYVYQYATCFASAARLAREIKARRIARRPDSDTSTCWPPAEAIIRWSS